MQQLGRRLPAMRMHLATTRTPGGLSSLWLAGTEQELARIDRAVGLRAGQPLGLGRVVHGRLADSQGCVLDEVLLARPRRGLRLLTGHGGAATCRALEGYVRACGAVETPAALGAGAVLEPGTDRIAREAADRLPSCRTATQAALLLTARAALAERMVCAAGQGVAAVDALLAQWPVAAGLLRPRVVAIAGAPNVGKSSLLNRLVASDRAFVHAEAGATRDPVSAWVDLGGYAVRLMDTAGLQGACARDPIEASARRALARADAVLLVLDASRPLAEADRAAARTVGRGPPAVVVENKDDLPARLDPQAAGDLVPGASRCRVSCTAGDPAPALTPLLTAALGGLWTGEAIPFAAHQADGLRRVRACVAQGADPSPAVRDLLGR